MALNNTIAILENLTPEEGLTWLDQKYGSSVKLSSALGPEAQLLSYWISVNSLKTEIFTIDTGRLFQETHDLLAQTNAFLKTNIKVYYPKSSSVERLVSTKGPNSFYNSINDRLECCQIRKIEPLKKALSDARVWVTGIRASQTPSRQKMKLVEWSDQHQVIKYNPLLNWDEESIAELIKKYRIPTNPLLQKGYRSIGCLPCTRAVDSGENSRAGRWWWEASHKECGLHLSKT